VTSKPHENLPFEPAQTLKIIVTQSHPMTTTHIMIYLSLLLIINAFKSSFCKTSSMFSLTAIKRKIKGELQQKKPSVKQPKLCVID
jgi:hypothetical protein